MKPCPNLPKGQICPLCGAAWICRRSDLPKAPPSTLAQQVASAQAEVATWPEGKLGAVKLAGGDQP